MQAPIAVLGLGLMGSAISTRLSGAGFSLVGYDVDPAKRAAFTGAGRSGADSVAQAVKLCDTLVLAVFDTTQVEQVTEGAEGIAAAARDAGRHVTVVCTSTCDPDRIESLAARLTGGPVDFVELPISGTSMQVARGDAVGLIGGEETAAQRVQAVLQAICPKRHYLGAAGNGARAKLAVNLTLGLNRAAMAEGLAFAEQAGLDAEKFFGVVRESAAYSAVMDTKGKNMVGRKFDAPQSRIDQSLKDFRLMLEYGGRRGQGLPFAGVYVDMIEDCVAHGEGRWDNAAIIEAIRRRRT
ncbi:MAG TPA: NAD(P)-dependent oxidoreductase [Burkholderiales bacterium]|jgi:3-hydroxyisobutyrate dehydrogenase-like beta-hydroxyacid dehydrogenase|nr:NAD(P)-dependent oxidoreductase [Burkholderiales bacterium]